MSGCPCYECDPEKNTNCHKGYGCHVEDGPCHSVSNKKFAKIDENGKPIKSDGSAANEENAWW